MLQDDTERDASGAAIGNHFLRSGGGNLERLLDQHVFSGHGAAPHEVEVRVRRREHGDRIDRAVIENSLHALALRKGKVLRELRAARCARAEGIHDLHPVRELDHAFCVRHHGHAEPDDGDARLFHPGNP